MASGRDCIVATSTDAAAAGTVADPIAPSAAPSTPAETAASAIATAGGHTSPRPCGRHSSRSTCTPSSRRSLGPGTTVFELVMMSVRPCLTDGGAVIARTS